MPRSTATILAIAGLSVAGIGAAANSGQLSGADYGIHENQETAEATVNNRTSNPAPPRASTRVEASSSSRASASASATATATSDGEADCATKATATIEANDERITVRQARRHKGKHSGCHSTAHATSGDVSSDSEAE